MRGNCVTICRAPASGGSLRQDGSRKQQRSCGEELPSRHYRPPKGTRAERGEEGTAEQVIPALFWTRCDWNLLADLRHKILSSVCWCGNGERQSQYHLSTKRKTRRLQIRELWKEVGRASGSRAPSTMAPFQEEKATPAVLQSRRKPKWGGSSRLQRWEGEAPCGVRGG